MLTEHEPVPPDRAVARDHPRSRDRHLGARLQPHRRRSARGARPEAPWPMAEPGSLLEVEGLKVEFCDRPRHRPRRQRHLVRHRGGRDARHRRRVGLRQERDVARADGDSPARGPRHGRQRTVRRAGSAPAQGRAAAQDPRPRDRDDLPGPDDVAEPGADDRAADPGGARGALRHEPQGGDGARGRAAGPGRHPEPDGAALATIRTSSRAGCGSAR